LGSAQTPLGELTALSHPIPLSWNKGDLLLRKREGCREGKGKMRGTGREGKERLGTPFVS